MTAPLHAASVSPFPLEPHVFELAGAFRGDLFGPDHPGYRETLSAGLDVATCRPALVAKPAGADDVVRAIKLARAADLPLGVLGCRSHAPHHHGVVMDLSGMAAISVNPHLGTVRVEPGATWDTVDRATQQFDLAVPAARSCPGCLPWLTLGGNIGHLVRPYGPTADSLIGAAVVAADGSVLEIGAHDQERLFRIARDGDIQGVAVSYLFATQPLGIAA